jgi:hypothetical protein
VLFEAALTLVVVASVLIFESESALKRVLPMQTKGCLTYSRHPHIVCQTFICSLHTSHWKNADGVANSRSPCGQSRGPNCTSTSDNLERRRALRNLSIFSGSLSHYIYQDLCCPYPLCRNSLWKRRSRSQSSGSRNVMGRPRNLLFFPEFLGVEARKRDRLTRLAKPRLRLSLSSDASVSGSSFLVWRW